MGFGATSVALPAEVRRLVGANDQLVGVERVALEDGTGRGAPMLVVRNPAGISFEVLVDRALDIGSADAAGIALAWRSPRGRAASWRHEPGGTGWTRTFGGGLLSTCGLAATGAPSSVAGVDHGLHGRIGHLPAENVAWRLVDDEGDRAIEITGDVVEAALGEPTLRLTRTIVASCSEPRLRIRDVVRNDSHTVAGHMFRHHLNLGYPLVDQGTVVRANATVFESRDLPGQPRDTLPLRLEVADGVVPETVLYARPDPGAATGVLTVTGADRTRTLRIAYDTRTFPLLVLWRDASAGVNVLGVEPSTSRDGGRARAETDGEVVQLAPGEAREYLTEIRLETTGR